MLNKLTLTKILLTTAFICSYITFSRTEGALLRLYAPLLLSDTYLLDDSPTATSSVNVKKIESSSSGKLIYILDESQPNTLVIVDRETSQIRSIDAPDNENIEQIAMSPDKSRLIAVVESRLYELDLMHETFDATGASFPSPLYARSNNLSITNSGDIVGQIAYQEFLDIDLVEYVALYTIDSETGNGYLHPGKLILALSNAVDDRLFVLQSDIENTAYRSQGVLKDDLVERTFDTELVRFEVGATGVFTLESRTLPDAYDKEHLVATPECIYLHGRGFFPIAYDSTDLSDCEDPISNRQFWQYARYDEQSDILSLSMDNNIHGVERIEQYNNTSHELIGDIEIEFINSPYGISSIATPFDHDLIIARTNELLDFTVPVSQVYLPSVLNNYCQKPVTDSFDDSGSGWPTVNTDALQANYVNGTYQVVAGEGSTLYRISRGDQWHEAEGMTIVGTVYDDPRAGIGLYFETGSDGFYTVRHIPLINSDEDVIVFVYYPENAPAELIDYRFIEKIPNGTSIELTLWNPSDFSSDIRVHLNRTGIMQFQAPFEPNGNVGLVLSAYRRNAKAVFDDYEFAAQYCSFSGADYTFP